MAESTSTSTSSSTSSTNSSSSSSFDFDFNLEDFQDMSYAIVLYFGSEADALTIDLDTGSSDIWVATSSCEGCQGWKGLDNKNVALFDSNKSTTLTQLPVPKVAISYGSGNIEGEAVKDYIEFTDAFSTTYKVQQQFLILISANMQGGFSSTGLAGMGFPNLQQFQTEMLVQNMYNANLIDSEVYMFNLLNSEYSSEKTYSDGVIFGSVDIQAYMGDNYANVSYIPVTQMTPSGATSPGYYYWTTTMSSLNIFYGGELVDNYQADVYTIIDTGTSIMYLNGAYYAKLVGWLGGVTKCENEQGSIVCECDESVLGQLQPLQFTLSGLEVYVPVDAYFPTVSSGICQLMISEQKTLGIQIFGDTFIKNYDVIFNFGDQKLGFSPKFTPPDYTITGWEKFKLFLMEYKVVIVVVLLLLIILIYVWCRKKKSGHHENEYTVHDGRNRRNRNNNN